MLKLAIVGDLHYAVRQSDDDSLIGVEGGRKLLEHADELLSATLTQIAAEPELDGVILLGDLTRDSEDFNHAAVRRRLAEVSQPLYIALGNHDLVRSRSSETTYRDVRKLDRDDVVELYRECGFPGGKPYYFVDLPESVRLIVLDNNPTLSEMVQLGWDPRWQDDGLIGPQQLAWLEATLGDAQGRGLTPVLVSHHTVLDQSPAERPGHPLQQVFRYWQVHNSKDVVDLLHSYGARLVLSGHLHAQSVNERDGVVNLVSSAMISYPHSWRLLTVDTANITVETRALDTASIDPRFLEASYERVGEGMGDLVAELAQREAMLRPAAARLREMVIGSRWWQRFADGTLPGFVVPAELRIADDPAVSALLSYAAGLLDEYGSWKSARPNPDTLVLER